MKAKIYGCKFKKNLHYIIPIIKDFINKNNYFVLGFCYKLLEN